jgi:L-asparagine oxygenase
MTPQIQSPNYDLSQALDLDAFRCELAEVALTSHDPIRVQAYTFRVSAAIRKFLPAEVLCAIQSMRSNCSGAHKYLHLSGLPIDLDLEPTPTGRQSRIAATPVTEGLLLGIADLLGMVYGFSSEEGGAIIHDISPRQHLALSVSSKGYKRTLDFHSDVAFHALRPHFLMLLCLRTGNHEVCPTIVADIESAFRSLSRNHRGILMQENFIIRPPASFQTGLEIVTSLITEKSGRVETRLNSDQVIPLNSQASEALTALQSELELQEHQHRIFLRPGEMLVFDNRRVVHGRAEFTPLFDGQDRWLQRVYVHENLWHEQALSYPERVVQCA